jgi:hypothetical protein
MAKSKACAFSRSQCQTESEMLFNPLLLIHTLIVVRNFIQDSTILQNKTTNVTVQKVNAGTGLWDNDSGQHHYDIAKSHGQRSYEARGKDQGSW